LGFKKKEGDLFLDFFDFILKKYIFILFVVKSIHLLYLGITKNNLISFLDLPNEKTIGHFAKNKQSINGGINSYSGSYILKKISEPNNV